MCQRIALYLVMLIGMTVNAQTTVNLSGTVSNQAGKPIAGAIVSLVKQQLKDTTGADGAYNITRGDVPLSSVAKRQAYDESIQCKQHTGRRKQAGKNNGH